MCFYHLSDRDRELCVRELPQLTELSLSASLVGATGLVGEGTYAGAVVFRPRRQKPRAPSTITRT